MLSVKYKSEVMNGGKMYVVVQFSSVQSLSRVWLFATPWIAARQASLSITNSWSSPRLTSIESVMPSSHLILCCPLLLLPPIPPNADTCMCMHACSVVSDSLWPHHCSLPGSSVHGVFQVRTLEWVAISSSRGSSLPWDWTHVSCVFCIGRRIVYHYATWVACTCI